MKMSKAIIYLLIENRVILPCIAGVAVTSKANKQ